MWPGEARVTPTAASTNASTLSVQDSTKNCHFVSFLVASCVPMLIFGSDTNGQQEGQLKAASETQRVDSPE